MAGWSERSPIPIRLRRIARSGVGIDKDQPIASVISMQDQKNIETTELGDRTSRRVTPEWR
jgi:hypothetical protein